MLEQMRPKSIETDLPALRTSRPSGIDSPLPKSRGFTLTELLVVVAIILLLLALLLPMLQGALDRAYTVQCMSNMRQLTQAWILYAGDNSGRLVNSNVNGPPAWVNPGNTVDIVTNGLLYTYAKNVKLYRCPADPTGRFVSYSINWFLNGEKANGFPWQSGWSLCLPPRRSGWMK